MRINLQCPFHEKDRAKQLGARWDPKLRVWYVQDVADLAPFAAWLPASQGRGSESAPVVKLSAPARARPGGDAVDAVVTGPAEVAPCRCALPPWVACECGQ